MVNTATFVEKELAKALYLEKDGVTTINPLLDDTLEKYRVVEVDLNKLAIEGTKAHGLTPKEALRCKNFVALGMMYWLYHRPTEPTIEWLKGYFKGDKANLADANIAALKTGYHYAETTELFHEQYEIPPAQFPRGTTATSWGTRRPPWRSPRPRS